MNYVLLRGKVFCRHSSMSLCGLGRLRCKQPSSTVLLARILPQFVSSRLISENTCSYGFSGKIRKAQVEKKDLFYCEQRDLCSLLNNYKYSTVECRLYSTRKNLQKREPEKRRSGFYILTQGIKIICLITGISVWVLLVAVLLLADGVKVEKVDRDKIFPSEEWATQRSFKFIDTPEVYDFYTPDFDLGSNKAEQIQSEIIKKVNALATNWEKWKVDDILQHSLGNTIEILGYNCCQERGNKIWKVDENERSTKWVASFYIEGSSGLAMLNVLFERQNRESEWVATKLYAEKIKESGEVICNVSSNLPNGLRHFTRLSDA